MRFQKAEIIMLLRNKKNESSCEYMIIYINPHACMHTYTHSDALGGVIIFDKLVSVHYLFLQRHNRNLCPFFIKGVKAI